jgi:glycolate oxidase FAD binding subunit
MAETLAIDGFGPLPVVAPTDVSGVCAAVKDASAVYPVGGGTTLDIGNVPAKPGVVLRTTGLNRLIDYPARDMTVTVEAGMTVAELHSTLAAENQWLPVDVPNPDRATIGGAVAANLSGPRRLGQGTFRDFLIGLSFVSDDGVEVKAGGRVVKNVAGYDLMKLHTGALGTLGVLTQLTFKVRPRPERSTLLSFGVTAENLADVLTAIHTSKGRPAGVELLNATAAEACGIVTDRPWVIVVGFEEKAVTVEWQVAALKADLKAVTWAEPTERDAGLWGKLIGFPSRPESEVIWKVSTLPGSVAAFASKLSTKPYLVHAHAGNGIVWVHATKRSLPDAKAFGLDGQDGRFMIRRCPAAWKKDLDVLGPEAGDRAMMRHVKSVLDPRSLFNPGRFV